MGCGAKPHKKRATAHKRQKGGNEAVVRAFTTEQATFACLFVEKEEQGSEARGGSLPTAPSMNGLCDDAGRGWGWVECRPQAKKIKGVA